MPNDPRERRGVLLSETPEVGQELVRFKIGCSVCGSRLLIYTDSGHVLDVPSETAITMASIEYNPDHSFKNVYYLDLQSNDPNELVLSLMDLHKHSYHADTLPQGPIQ